MSKSVVVVAGNATQEPALAGLGKVESALQDAGVTSGRAVVVCPVAGGRFRLVRSGSGKRKSRLFDAAELTWWIIEPIWFWLSTAFVSDVDAAGRRRHARAGLQAVQQAAGAHPAAVVAYAPAEHEALLTPALEGAQTTQDWTLLIRWGDVTHTLGLGWFQQRRIKRSSEHRSAAG